jgi:hypothetical protein
MLGARTFPTETSSSSGYFITTPVMRQKHPMLFPAVASCGFDVGVHAGHAEPNIDKSILHPKLIRDL